VAQIECRNQFLEEVEKKRGNPSRVDAKRQVDGVISASQSSEGREGYFW
jgi:hypothetical protein